MSDDDDIIWEEDRVSWEYEGGVKGTGTVVGFSKRHGRMRVWVKSDSGAVMLRDVKDLTKL